MNVEMLTYKLIHVNSTISIHISKIKDCLNLSLKYD